ncbi:hypothetical protein KKB18_11605 [bacterium]|nr:hypothetical protein [bacterium]
MHGKAWQYVAITLLLVCIASPSTSVVRSRNIDERVELEVFLGGQSGDMPNLYTKVAVDGAVIKAWLSKYGHDSYQGLIKYNNADLDPAYKLWSVANTNYAMLGSRKWVKTAQVFYGNKLLWTYNGSRDDFEETGLPKMSPGKRYKNTVEFEGVEFDGKWVIWHDNRQN